MQTEMRNRCRGMGSIFRLCECHPQKPAEIMKSDLQISTLVHRAIALSHCPMAITRCVANSSQLPHWVTPTLQLLARRGASDKARRAVSGRFIWPMIGNNS